MYDSVFIVVDTNTGRFYGAFTTKEHALTSVKISYCKMPGVVIITHEDVWNTDLQCPGNALMTIKRVQPKDFAEHL